METKVNIRETIIEKNYYLLEAIQKGNKVKVEQIRNDINDLISLYLKTN